MRTLEQIIEHSRDSRELKRALKVKHQNIVDYLQVSVSFISKWCLIYEEQGAEALLLVIGPQHPVLHK